MNYENHQKDHIRVVGVHGYLVLCSITNEALIFGEGDVGRGGPIALVVGDDLNSIILPDTDTAK